MLYTGKYISAGDLLGKGSSALRSIQPPGFEDWLRTNATKYDPVLKQSPIGEALRDMKIPSSLKCPEEKCIHYIYGFSNSESLEDHKQRQHYNPKKPIVPQPSSALSYPPNQIETDDHIRARVDPSFEPLLEQSKPSTIDKHPPSAAKDPRAGWESRPDPPSPKMARRPIVKPQVKTGCNTCKYAKPRHIAFPSSSCSFTDLLTEAEGSNATRLDRTAIDVRAGGGFVRDILRLCHLAPQTRCPSRKSPYITLLLCMNILHIQMITAITKVAFLPIQPKDLV